MDFQANALKPRTSQFLKLADLVQRVSAEEARKEEEAKPEFHSCSSHHHNNFSWAVVLAVAAVAQEE